MDSHKQHTLDNGGVSLRIICITNSKGPPSCGVRHTLVRGVVHAETAVGFFGAGMQLEKGKMGMKFGNARFRSEREN